MTTAIATSPDHAVRIIERHKDGYLRDIKIKELA
jgi:hypothetical protein